MAPAPLRSGAEGSSAMALLRKGQILVSGDGSRRYQVGATVGAGAFAQTYKGCLLDERDEAAMAVCLKVAPDDTTWHGESYFGQLLRGEDRVVPLLDSFPHESGAGMRRVMRFILVFELESCTVWDYFTAGGTPWTEAAARRELRALLKVLDKLHGMGATHRDIKPDNVFVGPGQKLKLGDFGIARHGLGGRPVYADAFAPAFVPDSLRNYTRYRWFPSDDLYQLALLTVGLIEGGITPAWGTNTRAIRRLRLKPDLTDSLIRAIGPRSRRFVDAAEMTDALRPAQPEVPVPATLRGLNVVFTGKLPIFRHEAQERLAQVGGTYQEAVCGTTNALIIGQPSPRYLTPARDQAVRCEPSDQGRPGDCGFGLGRFHPAD